MFSALPFLSLPKFSPSHPARLYLVKALTLMCFVFLSLLLAPHPAYAQYRGQWAVTDQNGQPVSQNSDGSYPLLCLFTGNGTVTYPSDMSPDYFYNTCVICPDYDPNLFGGPPPSYLSPGIGASGWAQNNYNGSGFYWNGTTNEALNGTMTASANQPLTVTFTYTGTRTPPPFLNVLVSGTGSATASVEGSASLSGSDLSAQASASDGLGESLSASATPASPSSSNPPSSGLHLQHLAVSGGKVQVSVPAQFSVTEINLVPCGTGGQTSANVNAGVSATAQIDNEAIPVNFHQDSVSNIGDGNLTFYYDWDSSTGNKADLGNWSICEVVTYMNNPVGVGLFQNNQDGVYCYFPPDPFEGYNQEPTQLSVPATVLDGLADDQLNQGFFTPYKEASYIGTQKFIALNKISGAKMSLLGPFTITRSVYNTICTADGDYYEYSVTKNGSTAVLELGTGR